MGFSVTPTQDEFDQAAAAFARKYGMKFELQPETGWITSDRRLWFKASQHATGKTFGAVLKTGEVERWGLFVLEVAEQELVKAGWEPVSAK
jgi:hypothetical protein